MKTKKLLALMMTAAMGISAFAVPVFAEEETEPENTVSGDAAGEDSFVVWGWNDDIKKILDGPFKEAYPEEYFKSVSEEENHEDRYYTVSVHMTEVDNTTNTIVLNGAKGEN